MSTVILLLITGLGLGALYFLVASGLSLIYGLMGVLNFAHGSFLTLGAFLGWEFARRMDDGSWGTFLLSILVFAVRSASMISIGGTGMLNARARGLAMVLPMLSLPAVEHG